MFGLRADGKKCKNVDPIQKITPHIMSARNDAQNLCKYDVDCANLDNFIKEQRALGKRYSYMDIVIASLLRTIATRPRLNRFVMNGRIFDRNELTVSFVVKKALNENASDSLVKLKFQGTESIEEVSEKINIAIKANSKVKEKNGTDKLAKLAISKFSATLPPLFTIVK